MKYLFTLKINKLYLILIIIYFFLLNCFSDNIKKPIMIFIPDGKYIMGKNFDSTKKESDYPEKTIKTKYTEHEVILSEFYISKFEITNEEFSSFINETNYKTTYEIKYNEKNSWKKYRNNKEYPVVMVSYLDAKEYCKWLSKKTKEKYRLPTEAEWEYVATGGKMIPYPWGEKYERLNKRGNYVEFDPTLKYKKNVHKVGSYPKDTSPFGVLNMYGNVQEWVLDKYNPNFYEQSSKINPLCIYSNEIEFKDYYVVRGIRGGYIYSDYQINIKVKMMYRETVSDEFLGFRIVKEINETKFNKDKPSLNIIPEKEKIEITYKTIKSNIPLKKGNGTFYDNIRMLEKDEILELIEKSSSYIVDDGIKSFWLKVKTKNGEIGWCQDIYLEEIEKNEK